MSHYERFWIAEQLVMFVGCIYLCIQLIYVKRMLHRLKQREDVINRMQTALDNRDESGDHLRRELGKLLKSLGERYPDDTEIAEVEELYRQTVLRGGEH